MVMQQQPCSSPWVVQSQCRHKYTSLQHLLPPHLRLLQHNTLSLHCIYHYTCTCYMRFAFRCNHQASSAESRVKKNSVNYHKNCNQYGFKLSHSEGLSLPSTELHHHLCNFRSVVLNFFLTVHHFSKSLLTHSPPPNLQLFIIVNKSRRSQ